MACTSRSAISSAPRLVVDISHSTVNSSPPKRARVSLGPHDAAQPVGDTLEEPVADLVSEAVVDELEAVEVEEHDRHLVAVAACPR